MLYNKAFLVSNKLSLPLTLVLNTSKTKVMWFGKKNSPLPTGVITTSEGLELEVVTSYKYLGVWLDGTLSFSQHISKLQAKVISRLGFLHCKSLLFHPSCQTNPDSDDHPTHPTHARLRRHKGALNRLDVPYHSAIRFAINIPYRCCMWRMRAAVDVSIISNNQWVLRRVYRDDQFKEEYRAQWCVL